MLVGPQLCGGDLYKFGIHVPFIFGGVYQWGNNDAL